MFFDYLFYYLYNYYDNTVKWEEYKIPFLSSVLVISTLQMFNVVFIRDLIIFQYLKYGHNQRDFKFDEIIIPTFFIIINTLYFLYGNRFKRILKKYTLPSNKKKFSLTLVSWLYIGITIISTIFMGYSIRYNLHWW